MTATFRRLGMAWDGVMRGPAKVGRSGMKVFDCDQQQLAELPRENCSKAESSLFFGAVRTVSKAHPLTGGFAVSVRMPPRGVYLAKMKP